MLPLIIYLTAAVCFIMAVVLLSFIRNTAVKVTALILFLLLFIGAMTFLLYKTAGQQDLISGIIADLEVLFGR